MKIASATAADEARKLIQDDILRGNLAPNEKLKIRELSARYGIGASPMREALARLTGSSFVSLEGQRGFRVTPLGLEDLADLTQTRQIVEVEALTRSMAAADDHWEANIHKSFILMKKALEKRSFDNAGWIDEFEKRHQDFHQALIEACPLKTLVVFCNDLYLRAVRYRRVVFGYSFEERDLIAEHENLMHAALGGDPDFAAEAVRQHIALTSDVLTRLMEKRQGPAKVAFLKKNDKK